MSELHSAIWSAKRILDNPKNKEGYTIHSRDIENKVVKYSVDKSLENSIFHCDINNDGTSFTCALTLIINGVTEHYVSSTRLMKKHSRLPIQEVYYKVYSRIADYLWCDFIGYGTKRLWQINYEKYKTRSSLGVIEHQKKDKIFDGMVRILYRFIFHENQMLRDVALKNDYFRWDNCSRDEKEMRYDIVYEYAHRSAFYEVVRSFEDNTLMARLTLTMDDDKYVYVSNVIDIPDDYENNYRCRADLYLQILNEIVSQMHNDFYGYKAEFSLSDYERKYGRLHIF